MKKIILIITPILLIIIGLLVFKPFKKEVEPETPQNQFAGIAVNQLERAQRPYIQIAASSGKNYAAGREVELTITDLTGYDSGEYTVEYLSGSTLQGFGGSIDLYPMPFNETQLLGSKSAGGSVTYHENIKGGNLILMLIDQENAKTKLKSEWAFFQLNSQTKQVSSRDAKFQLEADRAFASSGFLTIFDTMGLPDPLEGEYLSAPYQLISTSKLTSPINFTLRLNENKPAKLMAYSNNSWQEVQDVVQDGKALTFSSSLLGPFIAVAIE